MTEDEIDKLLLPGERERPTLKTIARLSGLAVPTVSRALGNAPDIGQNTKKRVRELADQLGYRPNRAGLRLRTGKTNVISLVLSTDHDVMNHTARLINAVAGELRGTAYHLIVTPYFPDESPLSPIEYIVRTGSADGVILNRVEPVDARVDYLQVRKFPFVLHGRTNDCTGIPYFDFDNAAYGRLCTEDLAKRGRRHLVVIAPPLEHNYATHLIEGVQDAAARKGIDARILAGANSDSPNAQITEALLQHFKAFPETDAVVTASVPSAVAGTTAIEESGRILGKDVDLASKESLKFLPAFRREILAYHEDVGRTGSFLARALVQAIDNPDLPPMQKLIGPQRT